MTNQQFCLVIGLPVVVNATLLLSVYAALNMRVTALEDFWRAEMRRYGSAGDQAENGFIELEALRAVARHT